jgi:hypothetical protein
MLPLQPDAQVSAQVLSAPGASIASAHLTSGAWRAAASLGPARGTPGERTQGILGMALR